MVSMAQGKIVDLAEYRARRQRTRRLPLLELIEPSPPAPPVQTAVRTAAPLEARQIAHRCQMLKHLASSSR